MLDPEGTFAHEEDDEESIADKRHKTLLEARLPPTFSTLLPQAHARTNAHTHCPLESRGAPSRTFHCYSLQSP